MNQAQGDASDPRVVVIGEDSYARAGIITLIREINPGVVVKASLNNYRALEILLGHYPVDIIILVSDYECDVGLNCLRIMHQIEKDAPSIQLLVYARRATSFLLRAQSAGWLQYIGEPINAWRKHLNVLLKPDGATKKEVVSARKGNFILNHDEWLVINDLFAGESLSSIARCRGINYRKVSALKMSAVRKLGLRTKNDLLVFLAN